MATTIRNELDDFAIEIFPDLPYRETFLFVILIL